MLHNITKCIDKPHNHQCINCNKAESKKMENLVLKKTTQRHLKMKIYFRL